MKKIILFFAIIALMVLSLPLLPHYERPIYLGYPLSNGFQEKGHFYDAKKGHTGIDLAMPIGSAVSVPFPLRVVDVRQQQEMGLCLYTKDAWGNILVFTHLSEILVTTGDLVKAGEVFIHSGNSGTATTGPHLHIEIIAPEPQPGYEIMTRTLGNYSGYNIDPIVYLEGFGADS